MKKSFLLFLLFLSSPAFAGFIEFKDSEEDKPPVILSAAATFDGIVLKTDKKECLVQSAFLDLIKTSGLDLMKTLESDSAWVVTCVFTTANSWTESFSWVATRIEKK